MSRIPPHKQIGALTLLPLAAALGVHLFPFDIAGVNVFGFRALVLLLVAWGITQRRWRTPVSRTGFRYLLFLSFWIGWAILSLSWAPELKAGVRAVFLLLLALLVGVAALSPIRDPARAFCHLRWGWVLAYVVSIAIATWEVQSGQHLAGTSGMVDRFGRQKELGLYATFGNPNNFGAFIVLAFPFLLYSIATTRSWIIRGLLIALLPTTLVFMSLANCRAGLVGLVVEVGAFYFLRVNRGGRSLLVPIAFTLVLGAGAFFAQETVLALFDSTLALRDQFEGRSSVSIRYNLSYNGLWFLAQTYGAGVGAGGFSICLETWATPKTTYGTLDPHNFVIEVLSQYGVLVTAAGALWILALARLAWRKRTDPKRQDLAEFTLVALTGYAVACVANSSYLISSTNWTFLATFLPLCNVLEGTKKRKPKGSRACTS
ncbi:MAG: O-antigen ligase family protein [Planctomycetes bacterium]|nr:O-antigen ligase family protein [Planctomycetota bacterium]